MPDRLSHRPRRNWSPSLAVFCLSALCAALFLLPATTSAQDKPDNGIAKDESIPTAAAAKPTLQERMRNNLQIYNRQQDELQALIKRRNDLPTGKVDADLDKTIEASQKQLQDLRQQFIELATNDYNLLANSEPPQIEINWQQEMLQVVYPLLRELRQLSERPRLIESLTTQIAFYSQRVDDLNKGLDRLHQVLPQTDDPKLLASLKKLEKTTQDALSDAQHKLDSLQHRYADARSESPPLWSSLGETARGFTTGMGWHFVLGLLFAGSCYFLVTGLARLPLRPLEKRQMKSYVFIERAVHFFSRLLAVLLSGLAFLIVLYSLNEWVLLGLSVIVIVAILLSMKNSLPNYLTEIRTMLNLGSIRQGERLIFNGLPWRIADLDVYTLLHNPALDGLFRVPLTQISRLSSRPFHQDEPWFPTKPGDYVLMSDGTYGRIQRQTPEQIQLNFGESLINYTVENFLGGRPQNLSTGFAVSSTFGIDYKHQPDVLSKIEQQLQAGLEQALTAQKFGEHCTHISVEYKTAAASSLDFRMVILMKGEAAEHYFAIQRWLQRTALECANRYGWEIPFQQVTVHAAGKLPIDNSVAEKTNA